jgi:hypothetical protein
MDAGAGAAALLSWARSASVTTPLSFRRLSSCGIPVAAGTVRRVLASADVKTPFITRSPSKAGLSAASPSAFMVAVVRDALLEADAFPDRELSSPAQTGRQRRSVSKVNRRHLNLGCIDRSSVTGTKR